MGDVIPRTPQEMAQKLKTYNKYKSRTWWLAVAWTALVPIGMYFSQAGAKAGQGSPWLTALITSAGVIVAAFIGMEKYRKTKKEVAELTNGS